MPTYCKFEGCTKQSRWNIPGEKAKFCITHADKNMIDVKKKICEQEGCTTRPTWKFPDKPATRCAKHRLGGMQNKESNKCQDCGVTASYGFTNQTKRTHCKKHKKENMEQKTTKPCKYKGCTTLPSFNVPEGKPMWCEAHRDPETMKNVISDICEIEGCTTQATLNTEGKKKGIRCSTHAETDMKNVKSKKCKQTGCGTVPSFNFIGQSAEWCKKHKPDDVVVDVRSQNCQNCSTQATFGITSPTHCETHKSSEMKNLRRVMCQYTGCQVYPTCNEVDQKRALFCGAHKYSGMVYLGKKCKSELCTTTVKGKYDGYCFYCFVHLNPDAEITRNYKTKEKHMTDFLKEKFSTQELTFDKTTGGCSKRRPDCYIDLETHVIIVECDENQHTSYDELCEHKRSMQLVEDFKLRHTVFIRFNPDKYDDKPSSFKINKATGVLSVANKKEWTNRLSKLEQVLQKWLITIPEKEVTFEYLFFDTKQKVDPKNK